MIISDIVRTTCFVSAFSQIKMTYTQLMDILIYLVVAQTAALWFCSGPQQQDSETLKWLGSVFSFCVLKLSVTAVWMIKQMRQNSESDRQVIQTFCDCAEDSLSELHLIELKAETVEVLWTQPRDRTIPDLAF